jgi:hypothetical protein
MRTLLTLPGRGERIRAVFALIARWVPGLGFVFSVLVLIAYGLKTGLPGNDDPDPTWVAYYADSGNRHKEEIAFLLIGLAGLCFLQFLGSVRGALARAEGEPARITTAAIASGATFIAVAISAHAVGAAISWAKTYYGADFTVDPNTARLMSGVSYMLFVMSLFAAAGMALAVATIGMWKRAFPRWLSWLSVLAAIAGVLGIWAIPSVVVLIWIAALSLYLARPRQAKVEQTISPSG